MNKPTAQEMLTVLAMTTDERRSLLHFHECFPDDLIKLAAKIEADYLKKEKKEPIDGSISPQREVSREQYVIQAALNNPYQQIGGGLYDQSLMGGGSAFPDSSTFPESWR